MTLYVLTNDYYGYQDPWVFARREDARLFAEARWAGDEALEYATIAKLEPIDPALAAKMIKEEQEADA